MSSLMRRFYGILFFIIAALGFLETQAQRDSSSSLIISSVPQYVFNGGFRLDIDKQLGLSRSWIIMSGQVYVGPIISPEWAKTSNASASNDSVKYKQDRLSGYGLELGYRVFLNKKNKGVYMMSSVNYSHFRITFTESTFRPYIVDGETFYEYKSGDEFQDIDRWMANLAIGYQYSLDLGKRHRFLQNITFDFYAGTSARKADMTETLPGRRIYTRTLWDYGVTGISPLAIFRIGFVIR